MNLTTYDPKKQKTVLVGTIIDGVLIKKVTKKHFMKRVDGYGIQESAFPDLIWEGVKTIVILCLDTGKKWISTIEDWNQHGSLADFGNGKQRFLSLKYMHTKKTTYVFDNVRQVYIKNEE
jgi:hypothetical protein